MPNQQPRLSEHTSCGTSCKNAKDKSNNTTLLAMRGSEDADDSSGRGSRCSSEKDSGYSDGSDWHHTDVEDQQSNKNQSRAGEHSQASQPGLSQRNPGSVSSIPAGRDRPPIYIFKDMVLQQANRQPSVIQRTGQLLWRNGIRESSFAAAPHMILFQQPRLVPDTLQLHKPSFQRSNVTGKKVNGSYSPILNSYPRIAPHPSKKPPDKSSVTAESQSLSKRVCTDPQTNDTSVTQGLPEQHFHKQPKSAASASSSSARDGQSSSVSASTNQGSPSVSAQQATPAFLASRGHHKDSTASSRHRRFLNTVEILRQSGLLDITLRTKELLRQSTATDRGIAQLRQHAELLCRAAADPGGAAGWEHVHGVMDESGSYPDLRAAPDLRSPPHPDSASRPQSDTDALQAAETSSPSPPPAQDGVPDQDCAASHQSASEQDRKLKAGEKCSDTVAVTPPDSSTG
ncbi:CLOCK-interacting pacemaker [Salarias fasciatus]|uniref:CLOCK-interacting pacemaker-like n=1 Tax=Salarias fasciatus TaxID=181472 RepID=A0A672HX28_SALFA|nr:CLOCK-interacting pacemaker-like [Salarias fasciatus]XP_029965316.1 CLOCK-interacting pacemaker-like [Salarias fasciatus]